MTHFSVSNLNEVQKDCTNRKCLFHLKLLKGKKAPSNHILKQHYKRRLLTLKSRREWYTLKSLPLLTEVL